MPACFTDAGKFTVEVGYPKIKTTLLLTVWAGNGAVLVCQRAGIGIGYLEWISSLGIALAVAAIGDKLGRRFFVPTGQVVKSVLDRL